MPDIVSDPNHSKYEQKNRAIFGPANQLDNPAIRAIRVSDKRKIMFFSFCFNTEKFVELMVLGGNNLRFLAGRFPVVQFITAEQLGVPASVQESL